ncbi:hypothetical protein DL764_010140 [Monosporascus ibericus]|uniref:Protein kinase domain-containing protein n=1 Tax=Monosporascus ibericus TaxID=155417 RepID=A0A4Q4STC1_9PEZI|nr:hypothetical protein DL764_010140 [Monosporascus ibericus]
MTRAPPRAMPRDVFVDSDLRQPNSAESLHTIRTTDDVALAAAHDLNRRSAHVNQSINPYYQHDFASSDYVPDGKPMTSKPSTPHEQIPFQSHTTAPSPPLEKFPVADPVLSGPYVEEPPPYSLSPLRDSSEDSRSALHITAGFSPVTTSRSDSLNSNSGLSAHTSSLTLQHKSSSSSLRPVSRTPSLKQAIGRTAGSTPSSNYPSPIISAMGSVTPLPSPLLSNDSPGPWKRLRAGSSSREPALPPVMQDAVLVTTSGESVASALAHQSKRKVYAGLNVGHAVETSSGKVEHARNRSISEYIPDPKGIPKRQATVSGPHGGASGKAVDALTEPRIRREPHLSEMRGLTPIAKPPTPPPSESSQSNDGSSTKRPQFECFNARDRKDGKLRRWRAIKELGHGTFSRVVLATSQIVTDDEEVRERSDRREGGFATPSTGAALDRKTLVAIKVCEHGPRGGASEDRIEMSLKRELEIMQLINHPSLAHLKAWNIEPTRALLVLSYCPGGDLFDVATTYRDTLTAPLLRRIFSELVGAVRYLHERRIVHRDIKLENVLVSVPPNELTNAGQDWVKYPYSVITLTDLGLSRFVADDEKLETRCGSDDYAAPEVILGQPYDGRATDAWSLGVLLYALLESRLPFDPHPTASDAQRMRSRTSHRIARVEWSWIKYAGEDGDHDANVEKFEKEGLRGAMEITEGLLKRARSRWPMEKVAETEWVSGGIQVQGGLKFREEEEGEEVL